MKNHFVLTFLILILCMISGCSDDVPKENTLGKSSVAKNENTVKWEIVGLKPGDRKIEAIKAIRSVTGLGLKDANPNIS